MKKTLIAIVIVFVVLIGSVITANLIGEGLRPEVQQALKPDEIRDQEAVESFKYLLAFFVDEKLDPATEGPKIYERALAQIRLDPYDKNSLLTTEDKKLRFDVAPICNTVDQFLSRKQIEAKLTEIKKCFKDHATAINRFNVLVKKGGFVDSLPPRSAPIGLPTLNLFFSLVQLKRLHVQLEVFEGRSTNALKELSEVNQFLAKSASFGSSLLSQMIFFSQLKSNREFLEKLLKEKPDLAKSITPEIADSFVFKKSFDDIARETAAIEVANFERLAAPAFTDVSWIFDVSKSSRENAFYEKFLNLTKPLSIDKNKTLNFAYKTFYTSATDPCVKTDQLCVPEQKPSGIKLITNPAGKLLTHLFYGGIKYRCKKLFQYWNQVSQPLNI